MGPVRGFSGVSRVRFVHGLPVPRRLGGRVPLAPRLTTCGSGQSRRVTTVVHDRDSGLLLIVNPYSTSQRSTIVSCVRHLTRIRGRITSGVLVIPHVCANGPHAANTKCGNVLRRPSPNGGPSVCRNVHTVHRVRLHTLRRAKLSYTSRVLCPRGRQCLDSLLDCITINTHDMRGRRRQLVSDKLSVPINVGGPVDKSLSIVVGTVGTTRNSRSFVCHN